MIVEKRVLQTQISVRAIGNDDKRTITGAIKYNRDSVDFWSWADDDHTFIERIASGAFSKSLKNRDVVALWSHDTSAILGNTRNDTLRITDTPDELRFEIDMPNTTLGNDTWELISRGDVDGLSFGMMIRSKDTIQSVNKDDNTVTYIRTVREAELHELSPVVFPAYPNNEVAARCIEGLRAECQQGKDLETRKRKLKIKLDLIG